MAINTLAFANALTEELDKATVQSAVTGFMADNALRTKFVGARTVLIPHVEMDGLGDYDRDSGFARGAVTLSSQSCVLAMDRARTFQIDREDNDETGIAGLAGELLGEFVRTRVVPEIDAYVLSKTAGLAVSKGQAVMGEGALKDKIYDMFLAALGMARNTVGFDEEMVCFVNSSVWTALQQSSAFTRQLTVSNFKKGSVDLQVHSINGVAILPVSDARMKTSYTFLDGTPEQSDGGFIPASDAKNIGFLLLPKKAVSLVKKTEKVRTFTPDQNQGADAYKLDYRTYYDAFVRKSLEKAVYTYVY